MRTKAALFVASFAVAEKRDDFLGALDAALGFVFGANKDTVTRGMLVDYMSDYAASTKAAEAACERDAMIDVLEQMRAAISTAIADGTAALDNANVAIGSINSLLEELIDVAPDVSLEIRKRFETVVTTVEEICPGRVYTVTTRALSVEARRVVNLTAAAQGAADEIDRLTNNVTATMTAFDALSSITTCGKVGANNAVFSANAEMLADLKENGSDDNVRGAAGTVLDMLAGNYASAMWSIAGEAGLAAGMAVLEFFVSKNPVGLAVVSVRDAVDVVFGLGEHYEQGFQMLCIDEIISSARRLHARSQGLERTLSLTDVAQTRILGERACAGYESVHGIAGAFLELIGQGYDDSWLEGRESMVRAAAGRLGLDMAC